MSRNNQHNTATAVTYRLALFALANNCLRQTGKLLNIWTRKCSHQVEQTNKHVMFEPFFSLKHLAILDPLWL